MKLKLLRTLEVLQAHLKAVQAGTQTKLLKGLANR